VAAELLQRVAKVVSKVAIRRNAKVFPFLPDRLHGSPQRVGDGAVGVDAQPGNLFLGPGGEERRDTELLTLALDGTRGQTQDLGDCPVRVRTEEGDLFVGSLAVSRQAVRLGILPHLSRPL